MKKFGHPIYLLSVGLTFATTTFLSCQKEEETAHAPAKTHHLAADWAPSDPELILGKKIYDAECALCHDHGEEQSPKLGKEKEWAHRKTQPVDVIIKKAIDGFLGEDGEMPARGGSDYLTDEEVAAAVKFMLATPTH